MTPEQRELLEDKSDLWRRYSKDGSMEMRDYNRRAADALDALLNERDDYLDRLSALRQQPEQAREEPVAWMYTRGVQKKATPWRLDSSAAEVGWTETPLYAHPVSAQPAPGVEERLREVLNAASGMLIRHHQWHAQQRAPDPEHGFIPADEYGDSSLCDDTAEAINRIDTALAALQPEGEG